MNNKKPKHPEFGERLSRLMNEKGLDKNALSEATGVSYEMIRRYSEGLAKPRSKNLQAICDALGTSASYLEYGDILTAKPTIDELKQKIVSIQKSGRSTSSSSDTGEVQLVMLEEEVGDTIPVISWVAAGSWTEVMSVTLDDVITRIPRLPHLSPRAFGLIIQGRSMLPRFKPGDTIYVEPNITPWDLKDGDLIVVHCNDAKEATFKQLVIGETSDDMYLKPLNPDWHEQKMVPMGECTLVGIADTKIEALR
jgi:SOS-response transcriptional repressor LexA